MTFDQYVRRFVDGYLFGDLRTMASIRLPEGQKYGGVGYPMLLTTLAGIELLGTLTSAADFKRREGEERFCEFWREHLYPGDANRRVLAALIYQMVRHGLAHTAMTKPKFIVTKDHRGDHLTKNAEGQIMLDALTLHDHFVAAYEQRVKPVFFNGTKRPIAEARFRQMRDWHADEYQRFESVFRGVPTGPVGPPTASQGRLGVPNSPSLPVAYSTQYTSSPDEDS
jgi:hypothetical protein